MKGWGPKSSVCPSKPRETNFLPGFPGIAHEKFEKKVVFNFVPYKEKVFGPDLPRTSRGRTARGQKNRANPRNLGKTNIYVHERADVHDPRPGAKKLRAEKLGPFFSFPRKMCVCERERELVESNHNLDEID